MIDLPLGAEKIECAEQSILKALTEGIKAFEPGLLKRIVDFFTLTKLIC
jgi:hypothetical protein